MFIDRCGSVDLDSRDIRLWTPLHYAAENSNSKNITINIQVLIQSTIVCLLRSERSGENPH